MASQSGPTTCKPGSIKLSYTKVLPDEQVQDIETIIRQAGVEIHECRRYAENQSDRIDQVVEIIAAYDQLTSDEWSSLVGSVVQAYYDPPALSGTVWSARKMI
jgi:hypothetical protein